MKNLESKCKICNKEVTISQCVMYIKDEVKKIEEYICSNKCHVEYIKKPEINKEEIFI